MLLERKSGILAHPTSLPGKFGIGDLGEEAYEFINFLKKAGQKLWQVLPLGPTSFGDSPYQSFSTFAGNQYLISPELLMEEGYLEASDLEEIPDFDQLCIDYGRVIEYKMQLLTKAYKNFCVKATSQQKKQFNKFCKENASWLKDYTLFVAAKSHFINERKNEIDSDTFLKYEEKNKDYLSEDAIKDYYYGAVWGSWPEPLSKREPKALAEWREILKEEIELNEFMQYEFYRQWQKLKKYTNENGISIIGDIPIFVAMDSSDVWANPDMYHIDAEGYPQIVAGVPPDYFSETGQLWGNPLYNWDKHKDTDYKWWMERIKSTLKTVDIIRIDHFRGFDAFWAVPFGEKTAINGKWIKGPGRPFFKAIEQALGKLPIIAEDLGVITPSVDKMRDSSGFPGMKVLQFAFDSDEENIDLPHNFESTYRVVYTGTHDNDTTLGWYQKADEKVKDFFRRYANVSGEDVSWDFIRLAMASTAAYAIIPIQDVMVLDSDFRMNTPSVPSGCWQFRFKKEMLTDNQADGLAYLVKMFNRK